MSKSTTITCDGCGASQTGIGYATLWPKLKRMGWTADNTRHVHFCKKCAALKQAQGNEVLNNIQDPEKRVVKDYRAKWAGPIPEPKEAKQ